MPDYRHLSGDDTTSLRQEVRELLGGALMPALEQLEREGVCPRCIAWAIAVALLDLAAWHGAFSAHGSTLRDEVLATFTEYFTLAMRDALDKAERTDEGAAMARASASSRRRLH